MPENWSCTWPRTYPTKSEDCRRPISGRERANCCWMGTANTEKDTLWAAASSIATQAVPTTLFTCTRLVLTIAINFSGLSGPAACRHYDTNLFGRCVELSPSCSKACRHTSCNTMRRTQVVVSISTSSSQLMFICTQAA